MIHHIPETILPLVTTMATLLALHYFHRQRTMVHPPQMGVADYIYKMARVTGTSEYEVFRQSAGEWPVSAKMIETDFIHYLQTGVAPYYVNDYVRKNKKHIDRLRVPPV